VRKIEEQWQRSMTRRSALAGLAGFLAGSPLLRAQQDPRPFSEHKRALGLDEMLNVWDFEPVCGANHTLAQRDYVAHGDGTEWTLQRNRKAFEWVDLVPGKAVDPKSVNLSTQVYQTSMKYPIMVSPARHMQIHPEGEAATHQGASAAGTAYIVASDPTIPLKKVAAAGNGPLWYQLYGREDLEANRPILEEAQSLGCQAIVVTADQQGSYYPRSVHDYNLVNSLRAARNVRPAPSGPALYRVSTGRLWYTWQWLDDIRKMVNLPVMIKGIMTTEDAQICVDRGLGIYVSNHGGRSLDYGESSLEVLPEIVDLVRGRVPVLIDSGFRRGTDILKALALGANAVCVGRVHLWGVGAYGAPGVQRVLEILQAELVQAAAAAGYTSLASINRSAVKVHFS
jgi:4-hydroxymandelate oxidase